MKVDEEAEKVIEKIVEEADVTEDEILEEIEEIQDDLSGFITEEGAANIVAKNHDVSIEREEPKVSKLLIEDVSEGMSNIDIVGRVSRTFEPTEFERKDGSKGKVANIVLMDKTGEIRVVFWGKMTKLISEDELQKGTPVRFERVYVKKGRNDSKELHLNPRAEVEINPDDERVEDLPPVSDAKTKISELDPKSEFVDILGRVIAVSEPREFERADKSTGKVATLRIIDETGQCRISLWNEKAEKTEGIEPGDVLLIENATVREGLQDTIELSVNRKSRIIKNPDEEETDQLPEFERKLLKIEEIEPDMPLLDLAAKVQRTTSPKEFTRDDGSSGRVMNVVLGDETGTIRASFWDDMVDIGKELSAGDVVLLENARSSTGLRDRTEIRVGRRTNVEVNPEELEVGDMEAKKVRISDIEEGLDSIEIIGRVIETSEVKEFTRDDGSEGKVASLTIGDETGTIRITLWEDKTKALKNIEAGDIIKITDAYSISGDYGPEVHVEEQGKINIDPEVERSVPPVEKIDKGLADLSRTEIEKVEENSQAKVRGTIVKVFERMPIFNVCPHCGRNLGKSDSEELCEKCEEVVEPEHRAVVNIIVDDGTDNIRVVAFGDLAEDLIGKKADEVSNALTGGLELSDVYEDVDLEGREIIVSGSVRRDDYFDQLEIRAREIDFPNPIDETERILERI